MRPELTEASSQRQWPAVLAYRASILDGADPEELLALAKAHLYESSYREAVLLFRKVRTLLSGRNLAVALVDGAAALFRYGDYPEAAAWLVEYQSLRERPFDGPAMELHAHCLKMQQAPFAEVDDAFSRAAEAFTGDTERTARLVIDWAEVLTTHGHLDRAAQLLDQAADCGQLTGYVTAGRARLAAAAGQLDGAKLLASSAIRLLMNVHDRFGGVLDEIRQLWSLMASWSEGPERDMYLSASRAASRIAESPVLLQLAEQVGKEVNSCGSP